MLPALLAHHARLTLSALALTTLLAGCGPEKAAETPATTAAPAPEATAETTSQDIFSTPYQIHDLDNGLRVILVKTDYPDVVSLQIPVQTGSRNEIEPGKSGFAHFFEHMMFRGTEKNPADVYQAYLKNMGADQNAYTTDDYTNYHTTFTKADLQKMLELEADRFEHLSYSEAAFRTEALAVKGEYLKNSANPIRKMMEVIRDNAYSVHTYKHTTMGFFRDIEDMPNQYEYSKTFHDRWYRPENTTIIIVGDFDPQQTLGWVKQYWGDWKPGSYHADIPAEPAPGPAKTLHESWPNPTQPWVVMAFHGPAFDAASKDSAALDVLSELYFGPTSPLYQKLVVQDHTVDQLFANFPNRRDPGLLYIGARLLDGADSAAVRDAIVQTLVDARTTPVDAAKLDDLKANLKYGFAAQLTDSEAIGDMLARFVHFNRTPQTVNTLFATTDALTPEDVRTVADHYFVDNGRITLTLANGAQPAGFDHEPDLAALVAAAKAPKAARFAVLDKRSDNALVDVAFSFTTGAAFDPAGKKGLAEMTAAMIADAGSKANSYSDLQRGLYPLATGIGRLVDKEMTTFTSTVHRDNLDAWYALMREQLLHPGFRAEDLERVRTDLKNAITTNLVANNDEELGKELLYTQLYQGHPYGELNLGRLKDLDGITLADIEAFYRSQFTQANLTVAIAGNASDAFMTHLKADMATLPAGTANAPITTQAPTLTGHHALVVQKDTLPTAVSFGFPISVTRGHPDYVPLLLVTSYLGEHRSSMAHLYQRIREARGMNYGDYAYLEYFPNGMFQFQPDPYLARHQQIFQVWLRPLRNNQEAHFATRAALNEIDKLITNGMTEEDFEATRNFLDKAVGLLVKSQNRALGYDVDSARYGTLDYVQYVRKGLKELTLDHVNDAIRNNLSVDNVQFVYITKDADDMAKRLTSDAPSPVSYNSEKPADLLAEDQVIATRPLHFDKKDVEVKPADQLFW